MVESNITRDNDTVEREDIIITSTRESKNSSSSSSPSSTFGENSNIFRLLYWDVEPKVQLKSFSELSQRKYNWNPTETGLILSAFYWSYILFTLPSEPLIRWFGEKWVMTFSLTGSALVTILTPAFSDCLIAMIVSRFVLGITQAGLMPSAFALTNNWLPLKDRALGFAW